MNLNKPKPFTPNKNKLERDWQVWKEEFLVYLKLSNAYTQFSEEQRALLLLNNMGTEAIKALEQISFDSPDDKKDMDILLLKFDEFFSPTLNEVEERCKFFSRRKHPDEDLDKYVLDMTEKATKCNFGDQTEKFILDMLILSMDKHLRDLIWASKLETLSDVIYNYKQYDINQEKMKEISESMRENLNTESLKNAKLNNSEPTGKQPQARRICSKCGTNHAYRNCPAFDTTCQMCFGKGHYTSKCTIVELGNEATNLSQCKYEESKATMSKAKQSQEHGQKVETVQQCLRCNSYHMSGKCPNDARRTTVIKNTDQAAAHSPNDYPRKNNRFNNHSQPTVGQDAYVDGFVEITNSRQAQPQRQAPNHGTRQGNPHQHRQDTSRSKNNRNKNENSDPKCCIS